MPSGHRPGQRGRARSQQASNATAPSTCCAAGSSLTSTRTSAVRMNRPDRRACGLGGRGPPTVRHRARRREIAGRSNVFDSIGSHTQDTLPQPPYFGPQCLSPRRSRPPTAPLRPRWTGTTAPPAGATSLPRRRTISHIKIGTGHRRVPEGDPRVNCHSACALHGKRVRTKAAEQRASKIAKCCSNSSTTAAATNETSRDCGGCGTGLPGPGWSP